MRGKVCQALADGEVNMLALQSLPNRGRFVIRLIVDKPDIARTVLNSGLEPGTNGLWSSSAFFVPVWRLPGMRVAESAEEHSVSYFKNQINFSSRFVALIAAHDVDARQRPGARVC